MKHVALVLLLIPGLAFAAEPSRGPDAKEVLAEGFRIYDPEGYVIDRFRGKQDSQDLLRAGFFIYDPEGRQVERFEIEPGGWSHWTTPITKRPPRPKRSGGYVRGRVWPTVRDIP